MAGFAGKRRGGRRKVDRALLRVVGVDAACALEVVGVRHVVLEPLRREVVS